MFHWLSAKLIVIVGNVALNPRLTVELFQNKEGMEKVIQFMKAADISIEKFEFKEEFLQLSRSGIVAWHKMIDSKELVPLHLEEESAGTIKLFEQAGGVA